MLSAIAIQNDLIKRLYVKMMEEKEIQDRIDAYELKTVAQLKDLLRELNVPVSGTKPELISKLMVAEDELMEQKVSEGNMENKNESDKSENKELFADKSDDDLF